MGILDTGRWKDDYDTTLTKLCDDICESKYNEECIGYQTVSDHGILFNCKTNVYGVD